MGGVRHNAHARDFGLDLLALSTVGVGAMIALAFGFSPLGIAVGCATPLFVFTALALMGRKSPPAGIAFDDVPVTRVAELRPGSLVRVRVTLAGPAAVTAPMPDSRCSYYSAEALGAAADPYAPWIVLATRWDGELVDASDSSGSLQLDFTRDVILLDRERMPCTNYSRTFLDDPLALGFNEPYTVVVHVLKPGDELQAVGLVERDDSGMLKLVPEGPAGLRVRWLARAAR